MTQGCEEGMELLASRLVEDCKSTKRNLSFVHPIEDNQLREALSQEFAYFWSK